MAKKARYSEMPGTFLCQTCKEEVYMSRYYQETYELPIDDWYWFATDEEAYTFFNYTPPVPQEIGIPPIPPMV